MFRGTSNLTLDTKGRLSIPSRYRHLLSELIVVPNPVQDEECLLIYPNSEWEKVEQEIVNRPNKKMVRQLKRFFLGQAVEYGLDKSGRILLTPNLRNFAELEKKVTLVGQGNKFELWSEDKWLSLQSNFFKEIGQDELVDELEDLTF